MTKTTNKEGRGMRRFVVVEGEEPPYRLVRIEPMSTEELAERGIGEGGDNGYYLNPMELIYLALNDYEVILNGNHVGIDELMKHVGNTQALTVYLDMRGRGYFIKPIRGPVDFLVWDKGKDALRTYPKYAIKLVTEGSGIQVSELLQVLRYSESMGLQLVLALISTEGVITYYKAFTFKPEKTTAGTQTTIL
ncbi:endonuclease [Vulcanisaeta thermophila]|uniref:endonuclease n=1 Tax=Vulcanisaeta thermophila TaxID=867917 RepID=UPI000852C075|nr:endonuclease [Vulcanisaeta thermophila]